MTSRRDVLTAGLAGAGLLTFGPAARAAQQAAPAAKAAKPLKILVMGGTGFLGPHFVEAAAARGHSLTLFNRGKTNPGRFAGAERVEQLQGDRKTDLKALENDRRWDAVLDTSAYIPADVTRSATLLGPRVGHYVIVSTISVYAENDKVGQDESGPLIKLPDPTVTQITGETYGGLKALCEQAAEAAAPGKVTVVRPGLIVGPGDNTDRFTYWPARADRGGEILAPSTPDHPTQFIDVRDLAEFLLLAIERRTLGTFNADSQAGAISMGRLVQTCVDVAKAMNRIECVKAPCDQPPGATSTITWVPTEFLEAQQVSPWQDMPVWIPAQGEYAAFGRRSAEKAKAAGLTYRPIETTVRDTLAYWRGLPDDRRAKPRAGLAPDREAAVLKAWHASKAKPAA